MLDKIKKRAKNNIQTIIFPEGHDSRIKEAVKIIKRTKIANPIVLNNGKIEQRVTKAVQLVADNKASGVITGATHPTSLTLKTAFKYIGTLPRIKKVSGAFLMNLKGKNFLFADCAVIPNPTSQELAEIAFLSSKTFEHLTGEKARIALLSYSTKGSGKGYSVDIVRKAFNIAKKYHITIDGELQADAAIVPEIAKSKGSSLKGNANVLIFPDLNSGNISYKLVQRFANCKAIGPIIQGLKKPVNDLSRGCTTEEIVDLTAITAVQAQEKWKY